MLNLLIKKGKSCGAVIFRMGNLLVSILIGSAALPRVCCRWDRKEGFP